MDQSSPKKVKVELDVDTARRFERLLRDGLVASGAVSQADNENLTLSTVSVDLDPASAARLSELLRDGLVASGAVSEADNANISQMTARVK